MYPKKNQKIAFAQKNRQTILPYVQARLINDIIAVLLFTITISLAFMLISYNNTDDSWFRTSSSNIIHNKFGYVGAYIADFILSMFGYSGWWLVIAIFYLAYRKITRFTLGNSNWFNILQFISFLLLLVSSTIFEYLAFYPKAAYHLNSSYGGVVGHNLCLLLVPILKTQKLKFITLIIVVTSCILTFYSVLIKIAEKFGLVLEVSASLFYKLIKLIKVARAKRIQSLAASNDFLPNAVSGDEDCANYQHLAQLTDSDEANTNKCNDLAPSIIGVYIKDDDNENAANAKQRNLTRKRKILHKQNELDLGIPVQVVADDGTIALLPSLSLLDEPNNQIESVSAETMEFVSRSIENKLNEFGVEAKITNAQSGPVVTRYEILPSRGVRGEKIVSLAKEIARGLALTSVRVIETIPGKNSMGIEVPNFKRQTIYLKEIFESTIYQHSCSKLTLALGKDIAGNVVVTDLAKMPHLLVAGTTGSGKSVAVNAMILSILFRASPSEVRFIMIDPKMVELSFYQDIPHLLAPVVTDMNQAANALKWTVAEMERRYQIMAKIGCKNIASFNQKVIQAPDFVNEVLMSGFKRNGNDNIADENAESKTDNAIKPWPFIVVIIDELADLMMVSGKKVEQYIARIAQKARAVGIHLILATQRPSVDVITGLIKANVPARIAFQVSSKIDSRTILDQSGAESLLGMGDMLVLNPGSGFPERAHGAYVTDNELNRIVEFLRSNNPAPEYVDEITTEDQEGELLGLVDATDEVERDAIFDEVVQYLYDSKRCSISALQTRFSIGYNRAARLMAHLESINMVKRNAKGGFELAHDSGQE